MYALILDLCFGHSDDMSSCKFVPLSLTDNQLSMTAVIIITVETRDCVWDGE